MTKLQEMNYEEEITKLTDIWFDIVGNDHHKDRDCHWYINKVWSYGEEPYYRIEHYGYVLDHITKDFKTSREAHISLMSILLDSIKEEYNWNVKNKDKSDEYDLLPQETMDRAKKVLDNFKRYMEIK